MEAHYHNKCLLYALLLVGSWICSFLLHLQFFHLSLLRYSFPYYHRLRAASVPLEATFASSHAFAQDFTSSRRSPSCDGRYVYMLDIHPRFDLLNACVDGSSSLLEDEHGACVLMSNAGLGPALAPAASGDDGVISSNGWFNTNQYSLEVIFHNRMRHYECLTDDPASSSAVYVPYYPGLELNRHACEANATERDGPSGEFLRWLSSRPEWAAHGGRDHFMVVAKTTWMLRRRVQPDEEAGSCGNRFLDRAEPRNMTVLTYESNIWDRRDMAVPYPSYFHPSSSGAVSAWQARARAAPRPWLFAFAGARRPNGTLLLRDRVIDTCVSVPARCGMFGCDSQRGGLEGCRSPEKLVALFLSARFCLQPRGDSFMRRSSVDAVIAGCVPVFFHEASTFEKQYRWHAPQGNKSGGNYSVFIDPDDVLQGKVDIEEVLGRYTDEEVAAMREEVIRMIPRLLYKDPRVRFQGHMSDAFDIAIDEVLARTRRIKNGEDLGWQI
ncbi:xyloglucan galactosyltransferase KATAMARI1 homolog [Brachypodium distachyon]|uniref:Exostosin GT47 domain-containing protein n=1 Tax=Brachypodium distachyon TaxID=15368 RepID=I1IB42_BRADI|nr:xyloglucan galactosyltransferase KATAMARI1 homolog [Brachypodium distachyon]KQK00130.1 hypothetical protein BRADI_3g47480v3 [Brachypodium distachyon]|eukprot:XP_003575263.1 xyloglucan galactosyltransferase KATAMARI1 homolog [Brachypodium distachyon]